MRGHLHEDDWRCTGCDQHHDPIVLQRGQEAKCSRCGTRLTVYARTGPSFGLALALTALGMFIAAARLPILEVSRMGLGNQATIRVATEGLANNGMLLLGSLTGLLVFWFPLVAIVSLITLNLAVLCDSKSHIWHPLLKLLLFAKHWAMPEVFLLAVIIAFIKIGDLAETHPRAGLWFLWVGSLSLLFALQRIDRDHLATRLHFFGMKRHTLAGSMHLPLALMLAALLLLVPANLLPILEMHLPGNHEKQTIMGGVLLLLQHGMWGIALVVFVASIIVPFFKIAGLSWLSWVASRGSGTRADMKLYALLSFIGRWSMLDVFLVALLAGLVHFGNVAEVRPGTATPVFAAVVILTTLAVEQFDTRRLWNTRSQTPQKNKSEGKPRVWHE